MFASPQLIYLEDNFILATSYLDSGDFNAGNSRMQNHTPGWRPAINSNDQWILVDLTQVKVVVKVAVHAPVVESDAYFVTSYTLSSQLFENDDFDFIYDENGLEKLFSGPLGQNMTVENCVGNLPARYMRLHPQTWHNGIELQWEIWAMVNSGKFP